VRSTTHADAVVFFSQTRYQRGEQAISVMELPEMMQQQAPEQRQVEAAQGAGGGGAVLRTIRVEDEVDGGGGGQAQHGHFIVSNPLARRARGAPADVSGSSGSGFQVRNPLWGMQRQ
jgi:hypothetical protein